MDEYDDPCGIGCEREDRGQGRDSSQGSVVGGQWSGVGRAQSDRAIEMTDVSKAMELLELAEKWLEPFDVTDPFSIFRLEGYLSLKPDYRYGAFGGTT